MTRKDEWGQRDEQISKERICANDNRLTFDSGTFCVIECRANNQLIGSMGFWDFNKWKVIEYIAIERQEMLSGVLNFLVQKLVDDIDEHAFVVTEAAILSSDEEDNLKTGFQKVGFYENPYIYIRPAAYKGYASLPQKILSYPRCINYEQFKELRTLLHRFVYWRSSESRSSM